MLKNHSNLLFRCRVICKKWQNQLQNEIYWKIKYQQYFPNYLPDSKGTNGTNIIIIKQILILESYFRLFLRGGVHLVQTFEQFKKYCNSNDPSHNVTWFLRRATVRAQIELI